MFHHVYCNLVMLAKSNYLSKNVLDMNQHYLKLQVFLDTVELDPATAMNKCFMVFVSEQRLYGSVAEVNHCLHALYSLVEGKSSMKMRVINVFCILYLLQGQLQ